MSRSISLLVDASNLHKGGGVQVGASLINELAGLLEDCGSGRNLTLTALASQEVAANVDSGSWRSRIDIRTVDSRPRRWAKFPERRYDCVLTVFGPNYRTRRSGCEIVGFALPRLIYPLDQVRLAPAKWPETALNSLRWLRFQQADHVVTETVDAAGRIRARYPHVATTVIPNCVSDAVRRRALWLPPSRIGDLSANPETLLFAAVGRDYPHKNLAFLGPLGRELESLTNRFVRFAVTLSSSEWERQTPEFQKYCTNLGILTQRELGYLYEACVATILPSLLEVSSATPLESLHVGTPVLVSSIPVMQAMYGSAVGYFDPFDATTAARQIRDALRPEVLSELVAAGGAWIQRQPSARDRAVQYLRLMTRLGTST